MRRAAKVDGNHAEVRDALRGAGIIVHDTSRLGEGFPDLVARQRGTGAVVMLEVKDGCLPPSARKLTPAEAEFHKHWPVFVVTSAEEALAVMGVRVSRS